MSVFEIIDDSEKHGKTLARSLKQRGSATYFAPDSLQGISIFLDEKIDVVLLDVMLGQEDGAGIELERKYFLAEMTDTIF